MTREEIRTRIDLATAAVKTARLMLESGDFDRSDFLKEMEELEQSTVTLNRELKAIGAAGEVCPLCGGAGRV